MGMGIEIGIGELEARIQFFTSNFRTISYYFTVWRENEK